MCKPLNEQTQFVYSVLNIFSWGDIMVILFPLNITHGPWSLLCNVTLKDMSCIPPKTNISPEEWWSEDYFPFEMVPGGDMLIFRWVHPWSLTWRFGSDHFPFFLNGWFVGEPAVNLPGCSAEITGIDSLDLLFGKKNTCDGRISTSDLVKAFGDQSCCLFTVRINIPIPSCKKICMNHSIHP